MKMKSLLGIVLSLSILQSCQNDETNIIQNEVNNKGITFSSIIDDAQNSRAYDTSWEANDVIGVFMLANSDKNVLTTNIPYATSKGDGYFVSQNSPIYYPEDNSAVDFIAYYPYSETISDDYKNYPIDLSNQTKQNAIDLMTAVNLTNRQLASPQGNLQFKHLLAKLVLNLKSTSGSSLKGIKASISGLKVKGTANLSDGKITSSGEATTFSLFINEEGTQAEAILLPQALSGNLKIKLELNGQSKEIKTEISGNIERGSKYIYNVNVNYQGGEITTDPQAKYTRWTETPLITESELAKPNIKYITHYTDQVYQDSRLKNIPIRNYSMLYDTDLKMAYWVAYPLCDWYIGSSGRTDAWDYDPQLTKSLQPSLNDGFSDKQYDRGHQLPSGDRTCSRTINEQTFYFTNMTPQIGQKMNQAIWAELEKAVRGWSSGTDTLYVVTGAMPTTATDKTIKYTKDNNGKNMAIPKYYFKVLARKVGGEFQTVAYKLENRDYANRDYNQGIMSVKELEELTGFTFFPDRPEITESIKSQKTAW